MDLTEKHIWQGVAAAVVVVAVRKIPRSSQSVGHWGLRVAWVGSSSAVTLGFSVCTLLLNTEEGEPHESSPDSL